MKQFESGRSMVEMLGTLAIIGVLSIGGIAGYSYGMDKYRANQTINDVMLMGVDIITQLSQQRTQAPVLSSDYGTKTTAGYDFTVVQNPDDNTQYGIQITGIPSSVCKIVGDALKQTVAVWVGGEEQTSDTKTDPCDEADSNTMEFYFEPIETAFKCEPECPSGEFCRWGECVSEKIEISKWPTDSACSSRADCEPCGYCDSASDGSRFCAPSNGQDCTINTANDGMCHGGECLPKGCTYDTNKCTGKNEYCASPNTYAYSNCKAFYDNEEGTCVKADFKPITVGNKEYWVSNTSVNWWDADAACKALGSDGLVGVSDLINGWNGGSDYNSHEFTALGKALRSHLGTGYWVWTSDDYDSCNAFYVDLRGDGVIFNNRYTTIFAVCR